MNKYWAILLCLLALISVSIFLALLASPDEKLHIIACNVGQGDAHLVIRGSTQIVIDGGPPNGMLTPCLSRHMPFWDREVELVVITHPELDHFGGVVELIKRYKVNMLMVNGLENSTQEYQVLKTTIGGKDIRTVKAYSGQELRIGLIYLDILHPSKHDISPDEASTLTKNVNDYSVVFELKYLNFKALFTGDIGPGISDSLTASGELSDVNLLKVPHHGSKNGLTQKLLESTKPEVAFISVGKNQWGHPNKEIIDMLNEYKVNTYRTDQEGDIELTTDGKTYTIQI